jgi:hypothetical protein
VTLPKASDRYRREAARLRDKADVTWDPEIRAELQAMSRQYDVLAESVERLGADQKG